MKTKDIAKALGRLGGRARAKKLSAAHRKKIASLGGRIRAMARHAERRVEDNFRYLHAIEALRKISGVYAK